MDTASRPSYPAWLDDLEAQAAVEQKLGELPIPSGKLVACDPLVGLDDAAPLERALPPGTYPVLLGKLDGDTAWARLAFSGQPIARWESAGAHGVDSGSSCFGDSHACEAEVARQRARRDLIFARVSERGVDASDARAWYEAVDEETKKLDRDPFLGQVRSGLVFEPKPGAGLVAFPSGAGDGSYTSWWGLDREGKVCTLLTDFGLVSEESEDEDEGLDSNKDFLAELSGILRESGRGPAKEVMQGPTAAFVRAEVFIGRLVEDGLLELQPGADRDDLAEGILPILDVRGPDPSVIAEALLDLPGVEELYASDQDIRERL